LNNIKDMLAGLPQFQEGKEAFSLHLNMASDAMEVFKNRRLADIASVEQVCPTMNAFSLGSTDRNSRWQQDWMKTTRSLRTSQIKWSGCSMTTISHFLIVSG